MVSIEKRENKRKKKNLWKIKHFFLHLYTKSTKEPAHPTTLYMQNPKKESKRIRTVSRLRIEDNRKKKQREKAREKKKRKILKVIKRGEERKWISGKKRSSFTCDKLD
jgi:hypothetical protein